MSIGNWFSGIRSRLTDRRWGTKISDKEGNDRDTGVQTLAEELAAAFGAEGVTEFSEPVRLRYTGRGPAIIIEDAGGNAQALQFYRRTDDAKAPIQAVTLGVRGESDGILANAFLADPALQLAVAEIVEHYLRGKPYIFQEPGGPGSTNVGSGTGGVGYPPKYTTPAGVQAVLNGGGTDSPCVNPSAISGYSAGTRQILTVNSSGQCELMSLCDLLKELSGYSGSEAIQVFGHESGTCKAITPAAC